MSCSLTDAQLEQLRDQLGSLADIALEHARESYKNALPDLNAALRLVPSEQREESAERVAIMEIDGRLPRTRAEKTASRRKRMPGLVS